MVSVVKRAVEVRFGARRKSEIVQGINAGEEVLIEKRATK
jgi:antitoxin (DNA-binding transcriptional repressor) of toxin-antitoxin stability system